VHIAMEDTHAAVLQLDEAEKSNSWFAVYDGHGGQHNPSGMSIIY
jgi:serine/threonine protein phosphatase PrpC